MDELADSTSLLNDQDGLRRQLAGDGYLFFRGLLPVAEVRTVGAAILDRLRSRRLGGPVPAGLTLYPRAQLVSVPPGPSRLVRVHPGWRHWQPPRAVH